MRSDIVTFPSFSQFPQLVHGISTRTYGSIKEKGVIFSDNLEVFVTALTSSLTDVVFVHQVHGSEIIFVDLAFDGKEHSADGLMTGTKGFFIGIVTADCLPMVFFDRKKKIIGVVHAGYKGILKGIIGETILRFIEKGSLLEDILIGIGPGIGSCCYNVNEERIAEFENTFGYSHMYKKYKGEYFLDLKQVAKENLIQDGINSDQIEDLNICTKCDNRFFSYRGDSKETFGEFATIIGIRD